MNCTDCTKCKMLEEVATRYARNARAWRIKAGIIEGGEEGWMRNAKEWQAKAKVWKAKAMRAEAALDRAVAALNLEAEDSCEYCIHEDDYFAACRSNSCLAGIRKRLTTWTKLKEAQNDHHNDSTKTST